MALKMNIVTINAPGSPAIEATAETKAVAAVPRSRDHGKSYLITEMPATRAEKWAWQAFLALARGGVEIPEDVRAAGMAGLAAVGFQMLGGLRFEDAEPLLDAMMTCVKFAPEGKAEIARALVEDDTQEVATLLRLRSEVFALHTGFSLADAASKLT